MFYANFSRENPNITVSFCFCKSSPALKVKSHEGSNLYPQNGSIGLKQICCTGLQNVFQGQTKWFLGPTTPNQPRSIENQMDQYQVWVTRRLYLKKRKSHKTAIFPALQKLTHMRSETGILKLRPSCKFVQIGLFDTMRCSTNECVTWCTLSAVRCNARQSRV